MNGRMLFINVSQILDFSELGSRPQDFMRKGYYILADKGYHLLLWLLVPFTVVNGMLSAHKKKVGDDKYPGEPAFDIPGAMTEQSRL